MSNALKYAVVERERRYLVARLPEIACTTFTWTTRSGQSSVRCPGGRFTRKRHLVARDGGLVAIDEHEDGTLVAEIDDRDAPSVQVPDWLDIMRDVTPDEAWTGGRLAH